MPAHSAFSGRPALDPADEPTVDLARRRLAALTAELAAGRGEPVPEPTSSGPVDSAPADAEVADSEPADSEPADSAPADQEPAGSAAAVGAPAPPGGAPAATLGRKGARPALASLVGWLADRLPAGLQGRVHLGSAQVGVVCLVVAVGLVLGAVWLVRADGSPGEVVPPRADAESTTTAPSAGAGAGAADAGTSAGASADDPDAVPVPGAATVSPAGPSVAPAGTAPGTAPGGASGGASGAEIVVDVVGKVQHPGIAVLPAGSRVADAVDAAGGLVDGVDRKLVNLARVLVDGEQIVVGEKPQPAVPGVSSAPPPVDRTGTIGGGGAGSGGAGAGTGTVLVNLNSADQPTLETLPGVGPVTAGAILEWRARNGAFTAVEELLEVDGIGEATLAKLVPHVTL